MTVKPVSRSALLLVALASTPLPAFAQSSEATPEAQPDTSSDATTSDVPPPPSGESSSAEPSAEGSSDASAEAAPEEEAPADWGSLDDFGGVSTEQIFDTHIYGYIDSYFGLQADAPTGNQLASGANEFGGGGYEWDVLNLHAMVQGTVLQRFRYFVNLAARGSGSPTNDEPISVRNAWVEAPIFGSFLQVRAGKTYRRFGLYNEILDAVPTFIGIEPPELFDVDHLMLTRTTNFMLHGAFPIGDSNLQYALTTGTDEAINGAVPIGWDLRLDVGTWLRVGTSGYFTGGDAGPSRGVGDGSPRGGVENWMARDQYWVAGGYAQLLLEDLTLQAEYWHAGHDATRDVDATLSLADSVSAAQASRFYVNGDPTQGVNQVARYSVDTFYVRAGYRIRFDEEASLTPYLQLDWYSNPETIARRSLGGDNEAGLSSDGVFWKLTAGGVIRPVPQVALKIDGSTHIQSVNGRTEAYPELRVSFSYLWELQP